MDLLRKVGLGLGLHEPLRTTMIEEALPHVRADLTAHDAEVRAQALRDAADMADSEGHLWSGAPAHRFFALADEYRARAEHGEA